MNEPLFKWERDIVTKWERDRESFEIMSKSEFDRLAREKQFAIGPLVGAPSKWMSEYGPYCPERFAFGELPDGRFVCCNIAEAGGES